MDVLANFNNRAFAKLDEIAVMLGFPGKLGMERGQGVGQVPGRGHQIAEIRNYCETDVLNTWLVYLRFEYMRGNLDDKPTSKREYAAGAQTRCKAHGRARTSNEFLDGVAGVARRMG